MQPVGLRDRRLHRVRRLRGRIGGFELQCWMRRMGYWAEGRNKIVTSFLGDVGV